MVVLEFLKAIIDNFGSAIVVPFIIFIIALIFRVCLLDTSLVCNGGIGTSQLLLARLEKFFHLDVIDIIPAHDIENMNMEDVDAVISTISLEGKGIEYIQVDPLLTCLLYTSRCRDRNASLIVQRHAV